MSSQEDTDRLITDLLDKGFNQELGFVIADWQDGSAELQQQLSPQLLNRSDILHGGVVSTLIDCLLYTSPSPRDATLSRMPSSA